MIFLKMLQGKLTSNYTINSDSGIFTFLNPYSYLIARKNEIIYDQFDGVYIDGKMLINLFEIFKISSENRVSFDMTSLAPCVFEYAIQNNKSVCFIGGEENVAKRATEVFIGQYPSLQVSGVYKGFFSCEHERELIIDDIVRKKPDFVIASMGVPYQECFLIDLKSMGWNGVGYTCGGFFHQTAKRGLDYYPEWMNAMNLRWLYRIFDEPKLIKRYSYEYMKFIIIFIYDYWKFKK